MQCSISGGPPKVPVVSPKSGAIFEKALVEAYIQEHYKDPITGDELSIDELIPLRATSYQQPRNATLNSVPSMLSALQNEWDAIALELFQLRKQLDDTRKELSTALYHHDAAVRVAAKAIRERDEARKALQDLTTSISGGGGAISTDTHNNTEQQHEDLDDVQMGGASVPQEINDVINSAADELFAIHKAEKHKPNVTLDSPLSNIEEENIASKPFKKISTTSTTSDKKIYVTSSTGVTSLFDTASKAYEKDESIHKNTKISCISKTPTSTIVGLTNGQVLVNDVSIKAHKQSVVSVLPHPSLANLVVSVDQAGSLALLNSDNAEVVFTTQIPTAVKSAAIHQDGALVACAGTDGSLYVVDLRTGDITADYKAEGTNVEMITVRFGSNGYWLFGGYKSGDEHYILVWDMRKDNVNVKIPLNYGVDKILLDKSSQLCLALSGGNVEVAQFAKKTKSWTIKASFDVDVDEDIVDGVVVDDTKTDVLEVAVVTASSVVKILTIS